MNKVTRKISITLSIWAIVMIFTGVFLSTQDRTITKKEFSVKVNSSKNIDLKAFEISAKNMELEINHPLSVNIKDYIENSEQIEESVIKALKLDTSMVNINEAGTYPYTITFKKKKYNANFTIKPKTLPNFILTLKNIKLQVGDSVSTNVSSYIQENLPEDVKNNLVLDLSQVTTSKTGSYQYTIKYDNKIYTANIFVEEKPIGPTVIVPKEDKKITP